MTPDYEVVWNGTRARGPYLLADYDAPKMATPVDRGSSRQDLVLDQLFGQEMTMRELAHALCLDIAKVNDTLVTLRRSGEVVIVDERWNERRQQPERVYGLADASPTHPRPSAPAASPVPPPTAATLRARETTGRVVAPHYQRIWEMLASPTTTQEICTAIGSTRRPVHVMLHRAIRAGVVQRHGIRSTGVRARGKRALEQTFTRAADVAALDYFPSLQRSARA